MQVVNIPYHQMARGLLFVLLLSSIMTTNYACNETQRSSLLSFALTLSSPSLNWTSIDCCQWEGITCDHDGWVTDLDLPSRSGLNLKGGIFPSLENLTHLSLLNLSHNSLYGSLESRFFLSLNCLEILDLSYNLLVGELPLFIPSSTRIVDLSNNHFHGAIPSSFFRRARNLTSFNVRNNTFSGFSAGYNRLSGPLPEDIYNATTLEEISLPSNALHGGISDEIVNLTNLTILELYVNQFSGMLPMNVGKLSKLKLILLHFNNLTGSLPPSLLNCPNLRELNLGFNHFVGNLSMLDFSKLSRLTKLDFVSNQFTGVFPTSLYSCKSLKALRLSLNDLDGQIQPEILSLKYLSFLSLSGSRLSNITSAMNILMGCKSLKVLILSNNFIGEKMPNGDGIVRVDGFQNLGILSFRGCQLTGPLPVWLSKIKKLEVLDLSSNNSQAQFQHGWGIFQASFTLNLGNNRISGELPKQLCKLPMLVSEQTAAQVDHTYLQLPFFVKPASDADFLQYNSLSFFPPAIYLYQNSINGNIPTEIGQLVLLCTLDLGDNNFSGNIPEKISNLKKLETLDLSMNHLSGEIPPSLTSLNFLSFLNVSYNNLEGPIPKSTQLQGFDVSAFEGNPKLCGAPLRNECPLMHHNNQDMENEPQISWVCTSVVLGFP
ncbi:tyrosine-sulfated glycopeptide receptor 1 [Prunus yedoensis var. nudiflora]|uniref:Tyrosine-sulfated glycopeptide receptor 1 n=1 Tax=Prunus yedoensis var. nudiflora TaxID=2094558 RepID=A0A314U7Q1_PRUYE|nr:tyrosine-sulfated glycopeptide receptor 1 [Prunus yedoensis var. nudiflora]